MQNPNVSKVITFGRKLLNPFPLLTEEQIKSGKLEQKIINFEDVEKSRNDFNNIDLGFCCLGTTRSDAGSAEAFVKIDQTYVINSATIAKEQGCQNFSYVSSQGANAQSMFLYIKSKGETENKLINLAFPRLQLFRPGILDGRDNTRVMESIALVLGKPLFWIQPKSRPIHVHNVAKAMVTIALDNTTKPTQIFENDEIHNTSSSK